MADRRKQHAVNFAIKKRSLIHTYDNMLVAKTRLFTLAHFVLAGIGGDVDERQEQLFFDDLQNFGIATRRLIELAGVKSFANHVFIDEQRLDRGDSKLDLRPKGSRIGFLSFVNSVVHAKYVDLIRSRFDLQRYLRRIGDEAEVVAQYRLFERIQRFDQWSEFAVAPSVLIVDDDDKSCVVRLRDVVEASSEVVERIVDKCSDLGILLEMEYRKLD